jgi:hypothetical protein
MYKWHSRKFFARLGGNFLISFGSPFAGTQIFLDIGFLQSLFIAIFSSLFVITLIAGREILQYADSNKS